MRTATEQLDNYVCNDDDVVSLTPLLKVTPHALHQRFWSSKERIWLSNDYFYGAFGFVCDIPLLVRLGVWQVPVLQLVIYLVKLGQLWFNTRWFSDPANGHSLWRRNVFIVAERTLRVTCLLYITTRLDASNIVEAEPGYFAAVCILMGKIKTLIISSGCFAALWHSILIPVPWVLELPLLMHLLWASLRYRIPSTMTVFQGSSSSMVVTGFERVLTSACRRSCSMVTSIHHGSQHMCAFQAPGAHQQLAATLNLFLVFILPLYIRYVQEYRAKLAFIWPYLTPGQRRGYMAQALAELPGSRLLAAAGHLLLLSYLLGMAAVLAWIGHSAYATMSPGSCTA